MTSLFEAIFELEARDYGPDRAAAARRRLEALDSGLIGVRADPRAQSMAMASAVFRAGGLRYGLTGDAEDFALTMAAETGQTACLGLVLIYVGLAQRVGWDVRAKVLEGHIRASHWGASPPLEIETTRGGAILAGRWADHLNDSADAQLVVDADELVWVYRANRAAFVTVPAGRPEAAEAELRAVIEALPAYSAAHFNLELLLRRRGAHDEADAILAGLLARPLGARFRQRIIAKLAAMPAPGGPHS